SVVGAAILPGPPGGRVTVGDTLAPSGAPPATTCRPRAHRRRPQARMGRGGGPRDRPTLPDHRTGATGFDRRSGDECDGWCRTRTFRGARPAVGGEPTVLLPPACGRPALGL